MILIKLIFRQFIQLVTYSYSGLILCYFILRVLFWDRFWIVALLSTFIPLILLPIFLLPISSFFVIKKHWFTIISSIVCICLLSWMHLKYWSPSQIIPTGSPAIVKILSVNLSWNRTKPKTLINLVIQGKPDIICLQETTDRQINIALPKLKIFYPYQALAPNAILISKYPFILSENLHLAGHKEWQQRAIININQQEIVIYNVQTISPWMGQQKIFSFFKFPVYEYAKRSAEIQDLVQRIKKETSPVIVAGDFNLTDQTQDYYQLKTILQDSFQTSGFGFGFTWPDGWDLSLLIKSLKWKLNYPLFRIDYIWYSKDWGSKSVQVLPSTGSEHLPIAAELILLKPTINN